MHFIGENWEMIKQTIHTEYDLTNISYNTWIEPLQFYDVKDDTVYIQIPTGQAHALNYISNKYSNYFKVTISGRFRNCETGGMSEFVVIADNEGVELVLGV